MDKEDGFNGFTKEMFKFLNDLERNNSKEWFQEHRDVFEEYVIEPAQDFVVEMGERLKALSPKVTAIPKTDKSIFRIYRDTRFSRDKTPYKTHIGILFWEGTRKKLENSGYYLQLNKSSIFIGAGMYCFPKDLLKPYRDSVVDSKRGGELGAIIKRIHGNGSYNIGGEHYKRMPAGYDPDSRNSRLLLHNGLYAYYQCPLPDEIYSSDFVDYCFKIFRDISPLHSWLLNLGATKK